MSTTTRSADSTGGIQTVVEVLCGHAVQTVVSLDDQRSADPAGFDCHGVILCISVVRGDNKG